MVKTIDLFILGVEKAGTTALFRHLSQSPAVYTHTQREMFYFLSEDEYSKGWDYACSKYFPASDQRFSVAKNVMQINSREAMLRLKQQCPDVRCVIMLREPASRAYSAYNYAVSRGAESLGTFEQALAAEATRASSDPRPNNPLLYMRNSTYASRVHEAFDIFGKERVLIIYHEDYKSAPLEQLARIETLTGKNILANANIKFVAHNRAAKARYPWLAKWIYRVLHSKGGLKKFIRSLMPHDSAARLRHAVLNFNRVEAPYRPLAQETAEDIRQQLAADRLELIRMLGRCPW